MIKIAVDAMGGDYAPKEQVEGAVLAIKMIDDIEITLYGDEPEIRKYLTNEERITIVQSDWVISMGEKDEVIGILATGLLHYLLTNALITSQRKIVYQGIELDIVIPNIKTLEKDPKKTLLICIPKSSNKNVIDEKISQLEKIQSQKENIWIVLSDSVTIEKKSFVISKEKNTFSRIIFDIAQFCLTSGNDSSQRFAILPIDWSFSLLLVVSSAFRTQ